MFLNFITSLTIPLLITLSSCEMTKNWTLDFAPHKSPKSNNFQNHHNTFCNTQHRFPYQKPVLLRWYRFKIGYSLKAYISYTFCNTNLYIFVHQMFPLSIESWLRSFLKLKRWENQLRIKDNLVSILGQPTLHPLYP